jgi:hypothetical protein
VFWLAVVGGVDDEDVGANTVAEAVWVVGLLALVGEVVVVDLLMAVVDANVKVAAWPDEREVGAALNATLGGFPGSVTLISLESALSRPVLS